MKIDFLQKYEELKKSIPVPALHPLSVENCDYTDYTYRSKNCYYCFECVELENCLYCEMCVYGKSLVDCCRTYYSELCYECLDSLKCYNATFLQSCVGCRDCHYSFELLNCSNCFGCVGLVNKKFCIFNKQHSEEEYKIELEGLKTIDQEEIFAKVEELKKKIPHPENHQNDNVNCPYGDMIAYSANCYQCFDVEQTENSGYIFSSGRLKNCWDIYFCGGGGEGKFTQLCYEMVDCANCYNCAFLELSEDCTNCYYSSFLYNCQDCWGCVELNNKKYCILNNQLTKEQYEKAIVKIKKELGWAV